MRSLALRRLGVSEKQVAGLSMFTTQSVTAVVEHIRDKLKAATPDRATFCWAQEAVGRSSR